MLVINNLTKYFLKPIPFYKKLSYCLPGKIKDEFKQTVLKDINISVRKGEILGIFGKNGAGKTTLLKIICNIIIQDKGIVLIDKKSNFLNLKKTGLVLNLIIPCGCGLTKGVLMERKHKVNITNDKHYNPCA
ncbi:MAG: ATP-binding cassette domain-containing protein [Candidatus Omnitrophica bacterium]|nr:ATP-binding cassette domain-containing protein [Candidatus Omnitrophota bacterium]